MASAESREPHSSEIAEVAATIDDELEEIKEEWRLRRALARLRADPTNERLDEAIQQGNEILTGEREEPTLDA
jgi:hypothetical protein